MNELQSQLSLALLVPYILQWLKGQKWFTLMDYQSGVTNRIISALVAGAAGFGVAFSFNSAAGALTITGLTVAGVWQGALHIAQQFLMQHAAYKVLIAPPQTGLAQAVVRDAVAGAVGESVPAKKDA